jgi:hypothetical protein
MNREERERMVNRVLNEALAPQEIEPRAGLEQRILANLRARPEPRPWWRWMRTWVPVAVAAVLIALAVGLRIGSKPQPAKPAFAIEHQPTPPTPMKQPVPPAPAVAAERKPARDVARQQKVVAAAVIRPALPRQGVFPSPVPLTPEETMLLALLRRNPSQAVMVAREQAMEWERILNKFQNGEAEEPPSSAVPDMQ